jgi:transposase InsO family protein
MNVHSLARSLPASRALLVDRVQKQRWRVAVAASAAGISTRTAYKWLARHKAEGAAGLRDRSSRPRRSPSRMPSDREALVVELRRSRLTAKQIAQQLRLTRPTVARALARNGLSRLRFLEPPQPANRYQWPNPGDLIHLDIKKLGRFQAVGKRITGLHERLNRTRGIGWEFAHVCVDDASRLAYVELLSDEKGDTTTAFLDRAIAWLQERGIRVKRVMTDNGPGYRSHAFAQLCWRHRVRHIFTKPYTPRTNGKAERFIQTLLREWAYAAPYSASAARARALPRWLRYYNQQRPHSSLDDVPPLTRIRSGPLNNVLRPTASSPTAKHPRVSSALIALSDTGSVTEVATVIASPQKRNRQIVRSHPPLAWIKFIFRG